MNFLLGQIVPFAGNFAPKNWMLCNGQILPIASNTALFSLLGTSYGGNGTTTFALPDLRGAVAVGVGQAPGRSSYSLGETGGTETAVMTIASLPAHTHSIAGALTLNVSPSRANLTDPTAGLLAEPQEAVYATDVGSVTMNPGSVSVSLQVGTSGGGQTFPTMMPYVTVNYCICIQGIFPQRP